MTPLVLTTFFLGPDHTFQSWAEVVAVVEHTPCDKETVGSNPAGCWASFFSSLSNQ